ncbi:MAG: RtcB family protein, partial [Coriobacteriales bacterium]|nr:RtcB family protein [Coriobacteriales bacterium]
MIEVKGAFNSALCYCDDDKVIAQLKAEGREREIQSTVKRLKNEGAYRVTMPKDLAYASGSLFDDYVHDMKIIQSFAALNRQAMTEVILREMGLPRVGELTTTHNYIDTDSMILRKGAVSAKAGGHLCLQFQGERIGAGKSESKGRKTE